MTREVSSGSQSPMRKVLETMRVPGRQLEDGAGAGLIEFGSRNRRDPTLRLREIALEQVGLGEGRALAHAGGGGIALRKRDHVGIVFDAVRPEATPRRR